MDTTELYRILTQTLSVLYASLELSESYASEIFGFWFKICGLKLCANCQSRNLVNVMLLLVLVLITLCYCTIGRYLSELLAERNKLNPFMAVLPNCCRLLNQGE